MLFKELEDLTKKNLIDFFNFALQNYNTAILRDKSIHVCSNIVIIEHFSKKMQRAVGFLTRFYDPTARFPDRGEIRKMLKYLGGDIYEKI